MLAFSVPTAMAVRSGIEFACQAPHLMIPERRGQFFFFEYLRRRQIFYCLLFWILVACAVPQFISWRYASVLQMTVPSIFYLSQFYISGLLGLWMINLATCIVVSPRCRSTAVLVFAMVTVGWAYLIAMKHLDRISLDWQHVFFTQTIQESAVLRRTLVSYVYLERRNGGPGILWLPPYARHWFNAIVPTGILICSVWWAIRRGDQWFRIDENEAG